jgi:hypothetical protein
MSNRAVGPPNLVEAAAAAASPDVVSTPIDVIWDDDKIERVSKISPHIIY